MTATFTQNDKTKLDEIHIMLKESVVPCVKSHQNALYGKNGNVGLIAESEILKNEVKEHKKSHWKFFGAIVSMGALIIAFFRFFN